MWELNYRGDLVFLDQARAERSTGAAAYAGWALAGGEERPLPFEVLRYLLFVASVLTVHNAGYQGHFAPEIMPDLGLPWDLYNWRQLEWHGRVNLLKGGLDFCDAATTVSATHAHELRTARGGFGLHGVFLSLRDRFVGIVNGIDVEGLMPLPERGAFRAEHGDIVVGG